MGKLRETEGGAMSVWTQLGLLLWKNFTYRRRQTVGHTCTPHSHHTSPINSH